MITKYIRKFLIRAAGLSPFATDDEAQEHLDSLHPDSRIACLNHADAESDEDEQDDEERRRNNQTFSGDVSRTVYAASGPGVQADVSAAGELAMEFGHCHQARITNLPPQYDQISGPQVLEPGVRVTWAMHPQTLDKQPIAVQFDSEKFTEDQARAWLSARNIDGYTFQPDQRDKTPVTQGNPRDEGEKPPKGFSDLNSFYSATIPVENDQEGEGSKRAATICDHAAILARVSERHIIRAQRLGAKHPDEGDFECPSCGYRFDDDPDDEPVTDETRRCRHCGELLNDPAVSRAAMAETEPVDPANSTLANDLLSYCNALDAAVAWLEQSPG